MARSSSERVGGRPQRRQHDQQPHDPDAREQYSIPFKLEVDWDHEIISRMVDLILKTGRIERPSQP